jgi:hypothetical protein
MFKFSRFGAGISFYLKRDGGEQYRLHIRKDGWADYMPTPVSVSKFPTAGIKLVHGGGLTTSWQVNLVRPIHNNQE